MKHRMVIRHIPINISFGDFFRKPRMFNFYMSAIKGADSIKKVQRCLAKIANCKSLTVKERNDLKDSARKRKIEINTGVVKNHD